MNRKILAFIITGFITFAIILITMIAEAKCTYCPSTSYGKCTNQKNPYKIHKHIPDGKKCIWCGSRATAPQERCTKSPHGKHER